jgi:CDP-diacylglycerol--glycerol-3-phosphate 3-phosphatidyltransferase
MGIFVAACLTDFADGYIARRRGLTTDFGKFMDPLADKVLVFAVMLWFVEQGLMPAWLVLVVIVRDFMVNALRMVASDNGRVIAASVWGKIKTVVTMVCLTAMFIPLPCWAVWVCIGAIFVTTVASGVEYFIRNKDVTKWDR